jgi:dTDP-4-amino-4,6-dideoxygalactose transaminase
MNIPMVDLRAGYAALKNEIDCAILDVLASGQFIMGPNVTVLEQEVAAYCGTRHALAVASGTDALHLALRACGIGPGDEVITTPFTFIATAEAISYIGAKPVFVDIDRRTFNIDPQQVEATITPRTKAILPVHLFGQPAEMDGILKLAQKHKLKLIEDCAQSFGATYRGQKSGAHGDAGCFSFYPSKNLAAFGDAGMIITNDDKVADAIRMYRNHGSRVQYHHTVVGYNSRLDEIQAVILRAKLKHIDVYNVKRRENAAFYSRCLNGLPVTLPFEDNKGVHVYHQYTILSNKRDAIREALLKEKIGCAIYYPVPLHLQEAYRHQCTGLRLPVAEEVAMKVLSLPMYPELRQEQIETVCNAIDAALK